MSLAVLLLGLAVATVSDVQARRKRGEGRAEKGDKAGRPHGPEALRWLLGMGERRVCESVCEHECEHVRAWMCVSRARDRAPSLACSRARTRSHAHAHAWSTCSGPRACMPTVCLLRAGAVSHTRAFARAC
eukprot:362276-Pleurochrysis_carterae.AAC.1